jgi:hypothetical protein
MSPDGRELLQESRIGGGPAESAAQAAAFVFSGRRHCRRARHRVRRLPARRQWPRDNGHGCRLLYCGLAAYRRYRYRGTAGGLLLFESILPRKQGAIRFSYSPNHVCIWRHRRGAAIFMNQTRIKAEKPETPSLRSAGFPADAGLFAIT